MAVDHFSAEDGLLLAKAEGTYGTDPTATAADDAVYAYDVEIGLIEADVRQKNALIGYRGARPSVVTAPRRTVRFGVELAAAGTAGLAPTWDHIAKACGLKATTVADTTVTYTPDDASTGGSIAVTAYQDGDVAKALGVRGNATFRFPEGDEPMLMFDGLGFYADLTSAAVPSDEDFSAWRDSLRMTAGNTPTITLDGQALALASLELSTGWTVAWADRPGINAARLTARRATGRLEFERVARSAKDFVARFHANATMALAMTHGTAGGDIIELAAPAVQIVSAPSITERDGIQFMSLDVALLPSSGDDDFSIIVK